MLPILPKFQDLLIIANQIKVSDSSILEDVITHPEKALTFAPKRHLDLQFHTAPYSQGKPYQFGTRRLFSKLRRDFALPFYPYLAALVSP